MTEQVTNVLVRLEWEQKQRREEAGTWKYDDGGRAPSLLYEAEVAVDELIGMVKALYTVPRCWCGQTMQQNGLGWECPSEYSQHARRWGWPRQMR